MQQDSRSSSTASPPPAEAGDDSDFYAQPNDSQTSILVGGAVGKDGSGDATVALVPAAYAELDFDLTPVHRLPNEILMHIFGKFDSAKDIFTCMLVCKRWARHSVDFLWHRPVCATLDDLAAVCQVLNNDYPFFSYRTFVRRINLSNLAAFVNDSTLAPLSVCSRLERLTLTNCIPITDLGLVQMVKNTPSLLALDVSQASSITGESINAIADTCRRLQGLNITNCINVSNESLTKLAHSCRFIKRVRGVVLFYLVI
jgi:F-box and leucine-rich repeat protein GRR1